MDKRCNNMFNNFVTSLIMVIFSSIICSNICYGDSDSVAASSEPNLSVDIDRIEKRMQNIMKRQNIASKADEEQKKYDEIVKILKKMKLIITENNSRIKDILDKPECHSKKEAITAIEKDIAYLKQERNNTNDRLSELNADLYPQTHSTLNETVENIDEQISHWEAVISKLKVDCNF